MLKYAGKYGPLALVLVSSIVPLANASDSLCNRWADEPVAKHLVQTCLSGDEQTRYSMLLNELERSKSEEEKATLSWLRVEMLAQAELVDQTLDTVSALELLSKIPRSQRADRNFLAWKIRNHAVVTLKKQHSIEAKSKKPLGRTREDIRIRQISDRALSNLRSAAIKDHPEANFEMARWTLGLPSKSNYALKAQQFADKAISLGFKVPAEFKLELRSVQEGSNIGKKDLMIAKEICGRWGKIKPLNDHADLCYELDWSSRYELMKNAAAAQTDAQGQQTYLWEMVLLRVQAKKEDITLDISVSTREIMDRIIRDGDPQKDYYYYQLNKASAASDPNVLDSLKRAADHYYSDANTELARLYFTGEAGIPKDVELAKKYSQRSKLSSNAELAEFEKSIKEKQDQEKLLEQQRLANVAARDRRLLTGTMDPVCDRWARMDVTRSLTDQCQSLTIEQQYDLLRAAIYLPGSYENIQVLHWERAQMLVEAEARGITLDSTSAASALGNVNKEQNPEKYYLSWLANKKNDRSRAHHALKLAAKYNHPKAYYELARLSLTGNVSEKSVNQSIEYLEKAQSLGFEVPRDFIKKIENEKTRFQQQEQQRLAEKDKAEQEKAKREEEFARLQVPNIDIGIMDEALHQHVVFSTSVADAAFGPALGLAPGFSYTCDSTHCYALGGIVKFRFDVESVSSCRYTFKILADCNFKYRLNQESGVELGQWRDNLLRGLTGASQISGYATLKFSDTRWRFVSFIPGGR